MSELALLFTRPSSLACTEMCPISSTTGELKEASNLARMVLNSHVSGSRHVNEQQKRASTDCVLVERDTFRQKM